jgi:hypothetical protein
MLLFHHSISSNMNRNESPYPKQISYKHRILLIIWIIMVTICGVVLTISLM